MEFNKAKTGWIAAAAAIAGAGAYFTAQRMRLQMGPGHELIFEERHEIGRLTPGQMIVGAAATVGIAALLLAAIRTRGLREGAGNVRTIEEEVVVNVPVSTAYNQWTQFEEFPRFMASVESVRQIDDSHLHWRAKVGGKVKEWDSEIFLQVPDTKIAWRSTDGTPNAGVVTFDKVGENQTRVCLAMSYEPNTVDEKVGSALGGMRLTAKGNLKKFKHLVEAMGAETGAWRGEIGAAH